MKNIDEILKMSVNDFFTEIKNLQQVIAIISSKKEGAIGFGKEVNGYSINAWSRNLLSESWNVVFRVKHEDFNLCFQEFFSSMNEKIIEFIQTLDKSLEDKEDAKIKAIKFAEDSYKEFSDNIEKQKLVLYTALKK